LVRQSIIRRRLKQPPTLASVPKQPAIAAGSGADHENISSATGAARKIAARGHGMADEMPRHRPKLTTSSLRARRLWAAQTLNNHRRRTPEVIRQRDIQS
jgi:hypothetical protein